MAGYVNKRQTIQAIIFPKIDRTLAQKDNEEVAREIGAWAFDHGAEDVEMFGVLGLGVTYKGHQTIVSNGSVLYFDSDGDRFGTMSTYDINQYWERLEDDIPAPARNIKVLPLELIAEACHEANRVIQKHQGDPAVSPRWTYAPKWQKDSAISGVTAALSGSTPEQLHEKWCQVKYAEGWTYGETKNETTKTHPCLVPYSELPREQRVKDYVFSAIVKAFDDAAKEK